MAELKQILKDLEFQQNYVGSMFLKPPDNDFSRINIFGEISQLSEFTADNLYLFYEFILPVGWKIDNENTNSIIYKKEKIHQENLNKLKSISQTSTGYINEKSFSFFKSNEYSIYRGNDIKNLQSLNIFEKLLTNLFSINLIFKVFLFFLVLSNFNILHNSCLFPLINI